MPDNPAIPAGFELEAPAAPAAPAPEPEPDQNRARYVPIALRAADSFGVPRALFLWQIGQESNWNPNAKNWTDKSHATGIAQFEPGTAKQYGLDPLNPEDSLYAAARYMRELHDKTGDWTSALKHYGTVGDDSKPSVKQAAAQVTPEVPEGFQVEGAPSPYAKPGPFLTELSNPDEAKFQQWRQANSKVPVVGEWRDTPTTDYDMRGYWKANQGQLNGQVSDFDNRVHLSDDFKTPYHRTFSNQSRYATPDAPHWEDDRLISKDGKQLADETPAIPEGFSVESQPQQAPQLGIKPGAASFTDRVRQFLFGGPEGETALGRAFPSLAGGKISDTPTVELPSVRFEQQLAPGANPAVYVAHGVNQFASGLTTPKNLAIMAATGGLGAIIPAAGYLSVAGKIVNTALSAYFADQMVKGASDAMQAAYRAHQQGNDNEAARLLGYGGLAGLMAGAAGFHAASSGEGVLSTQVPRPAARALTPEVVPPEATPEPEPVAAAPPPTVNVQAEPPPEAAKPAEAAPPANVPAGVPPAPAETAKPAETAAPPGETPPGGTAPPGETAPIPTGFQVESQPETGEVSTSAEHPDWFKPGLASDGADPIRKEGGETIVSGVRWQRTPGVPEVNPQGATFFSVANQAGHDSHSTYAGATPAALHWGGEHQVAGEISFSNPLELPTEAQGKYNIPLPEQIIRKLAGPVAADFDRHYAMEIQLHKFSVARGRGFLDQEAELENRLGIPSGTIADARQGPPGQIANSVAIALLRRDGYDGAIGRPAAPTDLAEAVRLSPLAPQAQDDALPKAAHVAPAAEPAAEPLAFQKGERVTWTDPRAGRDQTGRIFRQIGDRYEVISEVPGGGATLIPATKSEWNVRAATTTSSSPAEPPERKNELNELSPTAPEASPDEQSRTHYVEASRLSYDSGDIQNSYSADKIGERKSTIRKPFTFNGQKWVTIGSGGGGPHIAYQVVPLSEFKGKATTYAQQSARRMDRFGRNEPEEKPTPEEERLGGYHGMVVSSGKKDFVLVGPEHYFTVSGPERRGQPDHTLEDAKAIREKYNQQVREQKAAEKTPAKEVGASNKIDSSRERPVAYGHPVEVAVPGEPKRYPAKYALREAGDVEASHNPQSFEANPNYEHRNDRDYSRAINGARPVEYSSPGTFDTGYVVKESHTAEHGHTVTDSRRNALGGNARLLTQQRVYARGGADADKLKAETIRAATTYGGISPDEAAKFEHPLLTREVEGDLTRSEAQNAITDFNKTGAASLTPAEQALSDSRRVSPDTLDYLSFQIAEQGEDGTLAQVLSSSKGPAIVERLIADGVISANQRGKYVTDKGVTAEGKQRITQLMVGRLFDSPAEFDATAPELRNKLEKIVGPLARVEVNPEWSLTDQTKEAVSILNDARQHGIKNLDDLERQDTIFEKDLSDDPLAIARLIHAGQVKAAAAFRQYAADFEVFQKAQEGHAFDFLTPPTPREAFESAFSQPEAGEKPEPLASLTEGQVARLDDFAKQGWYSQMVRTIESKIPARVSPEQALAILKNPQHGVKADELKWTDMEDWLAKQTGPVTRQEILDHAISGLVSVNEKEARGQYEQYTLPGTKRHYTELLFTIPPAKDPRQQARREMIDQLNRKYGDRRYGPDSVHWMHAGQGLNRGDDPLTPEERAEWDRVDDAWARTIDEHDRQNNFQTGHFENQKNVVAHARFDERNDTDGKRVLFIEEIQSDWHQAGRDKGYKQGVAFPGNFGDWMNEHHPEVRSAEIDRIFSSARGLSTDDPRFREWEKQLEEHRADRSKVPQAPFSKTWHEMVFRRLMRHAAEKGFDSVAWTTGKQQAERYNLAKHVASVGFRPHSSQKNPDDPYGDLIVKRNGREEWEDIAHIDASKLPDYLGKEVARKLLAQPIDPEYGEHTLSGENLQVGGHGMSGFYDSILPAYAAKFGKKWGEKPQLKPIPTNTFPFGAHYEGPEWPIDRVEAAIELAGHGGLDVRHSPFTGRHLADEYSLAAYYEDLQKLGDLLDEDVPFHQAVDQVESGLPLGFAALFGGRQKSGQRERPSTQQVHSLAITPEMRESVMQGQPLFVRTVPLEPGQKHSIESVARNIDWRITPATPRRPAILRVNHQAALAISEAGGIEQFDGSTLADESLDGIASEMRAAARGWRIQGTLTPEGEAHIDALSKGLEEMQGQGWRAAVVTREDLPGAPFASIRKNARTESEELTHVQQVHYTAGYDPAQHLTPAMRRFVLEHPAWKQGLWDALEKKRYGSNKSLHVNILEAGAKLASGDPMGLTPEQAISFLKRYFQALRETHGLVPASEVFRFATRPIRTTLGVENAPREVPTAVRRTRPTRGQDRNYGHGEEVATDTGDGANGPRATREPVRPLAEAGRSGDSGSLFGDDETQEVADSAARDRDQLTGQRLTAQFRSPLTREEQLKKLKRTDKDPDAGPQSDFFAPPDEKPQGSLFSKSKDDEGVTLGAGLGAMQPYLQRFLKGDVVPTLKQVAELTRLYKGDLLKLLAPAAVEGAEPMALSVRHRAAELARATDVAHATLKAAGKYFDTRPDAENFDFIDRVETGAKQPTPELQAIHDIMRAMLDTRRDAIRALGTGKLQKAIENYFPHLYKDPKTAQQVFENAGKRPLEGSKSFLKKRTIFTLKDAMAAPHNLEPFSANPVDFVLAKVREMDKYLAAHRIFADAKERGQLVAIDARDGQAPNGWKQIDDPMATIYGPSIQQISEYPNEGLHTGLDTVANALGLKQERGFLNLRGAIGRASRAGSTVKTLHGTAEDVLAHEIGHQIDWLAGSGKRFVEQYPDAASAARLKQAYKTLKPGSGSTLADRQAARKELKDLAPQIQQRKAFAKELRDLADLRGGRPAYIRKREEKMAQLAQMWVGAREQFERTAPTVFKEWKRFLDDNPKLHALRDIEGNAKVQSLSQPYDVGGLVVKARWWAPEPAARILNNYLSPGLRDKSAIVRSVLSVSNFLNQAQLGFSGFHAAFTLTEAATSHLALAIYQGVNGILDGDALSVAKSFKTAALAPAAPFTSLMRGHLMLKEWNRPGSQGALIGQLADAAVTAGGRAKQESFYQTHIGERVMKAWREGNVFGAAWRAPFAAFEIPTRLIMEGLVPRLKMGAFASMAEHELARLGPNAAPMDVERALAKVWDSIDNRFGQLVYDDLFWHKYTKDLAMMLVRSPGWNVGDIRELGGGYSDSAKFATLSMKKVAGQGGRPEFTHRMAYIPAHLIVALTLGGLLYYAWHKKAPERLVDWFFPTDPHGQRWSLPTYVKDEFHWATAPLSTAGAKLNPIVPFAKAIVTNKDYFGRKIAHGHHWPAELKQFAEYVLTQFEPLWMQQNHHALHRQTTADKVLPELGITHAPKALDKHSSGGGSVHLHR